MRSALDSAQSSEINTSTGVVARVEPIADRGGLAIRTADIALQFALRLLSESRATREKAMDEEIAGIWLLPVSKRRLACQGGNCDGLR